MQDDKDQVQTYCVSSRHALNFSGARIRVGRAVGLLTVAWQSPSWVAVTSTVCRCQLGNGCTEDPRMSY